MICSINVTAVQYMHIKMGNRSCFISSDWFVNLLYTTTQSILFCKNSFLFDFHSKSKTSEVDLNWVKRKALAWHYESIFILHPKHLQWFGCQSCHWVSELNFVIVKLLEISWDNPTKEVDHRQSIDFTKKFTENL